MGHRAAAEFSTHADAAGSWISGRHLYPLDRYICAREDAPSGDAHSARRDPPLHARQGRDRALREGRKPGLLPRWTGIRAIPGSRHGSPAQSGAPDRSVVDAFDRDGPAAASAVTMAYDTRTDVLDSTLAFGSGHSFRAFELGTGMDWRTNECGGH